ncbi:Cu-Zn family superoxide dismutase [Rhodoligotrophos appendicifer]|uniref:superoxide dismutase family protein n=1 Tax=Rhodoligotrophos appendicifer TaxID=987056 RepID=UPI001184D110|nr:superoxide dismutase family protein [Rhodoligotrophos appendicifer]
MKMILATAILAASTNLGLAQEVNPPAADAKAEFINAEGKMIGSATLAKTPRGVLIRASFSDLEPGMHGFHIHEIGECDPATEFSSAGGHYAPRGNEHGYMSEKGPHAGDMPNQWAAADRSMTVEVFNDQLSLEGGEAPIFDADGSAIVVHSKTDDYISQPSGAAGDRIACGVIQKP